ncbi:hypothetical protein KDK_48520 [Dictyobacter kobayashii]|uniref:Uncharacterized protein n=1 Tax=Dictyobacter kobayashii TaxID=2014872 RepID=A0A402APM8_9CHLR|nr:hypothetical protein KDK_48520 [Dictyobacter kobayashii]
MLGKWTRLQRWWMHLVGQRAIEQKALLMHDLVKPEIAARPAYHLTMGLVLTPQMR